MGQGGPSPQNFNLYPEETESLLNPLFMSPLLTEKDPRRLREPQRACPGLLCKTGAHLEKFRSWENPDSRPLQRWSQQPEGSTGLCDFPAIHLMGRNRADRRRLEGGWAGPASGACNPHSHAGAQKGTHSV